MSQRRSRPQSAQSPSRMSPHVAAKSDAPSSSSSSFQAPRRAAYAEPEELLQQLRAFKEQHSTLKQENVYLKTQLQRYVAMCRKREKHIQQIMDLKIQSCQETSGAVIVLGKLNELKGEMLSIGKLSDKIRDLELQLLRKDDEIKKLKNMTKIINLKELEQESNIYYTECRRLKQQVSLLQRNITPPQHVNNLQSRHAMENEENQAKNNDDQQRENQRLKESLMKKDHEIAELTSLVEQLRAPPVTTSPTHHHTPSNQHTSISPKYKQPQSSTTQSNHHKSSSSPRHNSTQLQAGSNPPSSTHDSHLTHAHTVVETDTYVQQTQYDAAHHQQTHYIQHQHTTQYNDYDNNNSQHQEQQNNQYYATHNYTDNVNDYYAANYSAAL